MDTLQFKYRIEAVELIAASSGVYGGSTALNVKYNRFCNDQGDRNTNKPGDLKVKHHFTLDYLVIPPICSPFS